MPSLAQRSDLSTRLMSRIVHEQADPPSFVDMTREGVARRLYRCLLHRLYCHLLQGIAPSMPDREDREHHDRAHHQGYTEISATPIWCAGAPYVTIIKAYHPVRHRGLIPNAPLAVCALFATLPRFIRYLRRSVL